jgi:hypothetical protein
MANILQFPSSLCTKPPKPSPSPAEVAPNRPRPGPHLVISNARPAPLLLSTDERWTALGPVDEEIAQRSSQRHLRRLFRSSDYTDNWPLGAA